MIKVKNIYDIFLKFFDKLGNYIIYIIILLFIIILFGILISIFRLFFI